MKITAHTLVKNEQRFLWFSINSVINYVDKILLWDTGSTDKTREIVKLLKTKYKEKIETKFLKSISSNEFPQIRQQMLDSTNADWILMLDGDEVWWEDSIKKVYSLIQREGNKIESIVVPNYMLIGDMYHYQEKKAGQYKFERRKGHYNLRALSTRIPGLKSKGRHGIWGWVDKNEKRIQERKRIKYVNAPYLHASFLQRGGCIKKDKDVPKRKRKLKYEIGDPFPLDFYYPETFFRRKPQIILSPWNTMSNKYRARAIVETPLKKIKRRIIPSKVGY